MWRGGTPPSLAQMWSLQHLSRPSSRLASCTESCSWKRFHAAPTAQQLPLARARIYRPRTRALAAAEGFPPNAFWRRSDPHWRGGFSLGVDLGLCQTGLALSKGYTVRPLTVLKLRGQKLEIRLMEIAEEEEADEFIIGLPKSSDGNETPQSNKVRSVAGRLAARAAERGRRVYLQDEYGTSIEAVDRMITMGFSRNAQEKQNDAYAAVVLLERYFSMSGQETQLVLPKQVNLQENLRRGTPLDIDLFPEEPNN